MSDQYPFQSQECREQKKFGKTLETLENPTWLLLFIFHTGTLGIEG